MVQTDRPPFLTISTVPRSVSAPSGIGRGCLLFAAAISLALVALLWTTPIRWLVPIAATTAIVAAVVDWQAMRVPNRLTLVGFVATLVVASPLVLGAALGVRDLLLGVVVMAGPLLVTHLASRGRTPGLGDVKLAGVLGMTLGAASAMTAYVALLASLLLGALFGLWYQRRTGRRGFPFAPAIATATIGVLVVAGAAERGVV